MKSDLTCAKTILEQLGGNRFTKMTGAKNYLGGERSLIFRLPGGGGFVKNNGNHFRVELKGDDTYTLTLSRVRGSDLTMIEQQEGVYVENLQEVFTSMTGLYTRL